MKLICCVKCNEMFNLSHDYKECSKGHVGGQYVNDLDAKVWGHKRDIVVIGFANSTLLNAITAQYQLGDLAKTMHYGGETVSPGREFKAFVMPDATPSVHRFNTKEEYDAV